MRGLLASLALAALALAPPVGARAPDPPQPAIDYSQDATWLCRPGRKDACAVDLDALAVKPDGSRSVERFKPAAAPKIDCFYVYPTVSQEEGPFASMTVDHEVAAVARVQAARFASKCRVFAPLYRQLTGPGLSRQMQAHGAAAPIDWTPPYEDVKAAWRDYLASDNRGRGVVLIGHSQGSILLSRLIKEEVEGKPAARLLVSALLAGHPAVTAPDGKDVGGTFASTPICRSIGQVGCVVVFSSYAVDDAPPFRLFGRHAGPAMKAVCVNPARPPGGKAALTAYYPKPKTAPAADPPFIKGVGEYSGECVTDATGSVLRISVEPGALAEASNTAIATIPLARNGWGLHVMDMTITQGALLDLVDAQAKTWAAKGGR